MHIAGVVFILFLCSPYCTAVFGDKPCYTAGGPTEKMLVCRPVTKPETHIDLIVASTKTIKFDCSADLFDVEPTEREIVLENVQSFRPPSTSISSLSVKDCLRFGVNLTWILRSWGLTLSAVDSFTYENSYSEFNLSSSSLEGLDNLKYVSIHRGLESIRQEHLKSMVNLEQLLLHENLLNNVSGAFTHLKKLKLLQLGSNRIETIDDFSFESLLALKQLNLEANQIVNVTENTFKNLGNLTILGLSINNLTHLPPLLFEDNENLQELGLARNFLQSVPSSLFRNMRNLLKLDLSGNLQLSELPEDLFTNTTNLKNLNLSNCNISSLSSALFRSLNGLETLDLSHNQISVITEETFKSLTNLVSLNLGYNRLREIGDGVFVWLEKLNILQLPYNKLRVISSNAFDRGCSVKTLDASGNLLAFEEDDEQSPFRSCTKLRHLDLSFNNISSILEDWLLFMDGLSRLNLAHNSFTSLDFNSLTFLSREDLEVDLRNSSIEVVDVSLAHLQDVNPSNSRKTLLLDHNPVNCDCRAYPLAQYLNHTLPGPVFSWDITGAVCSEPANLAGQEVVSVDPLDFVCTSAGFATRCPANCSCTQRPADKTILANCGRKPDSYGFVTQGFSVQLNLSGSSVRLNSLTQNETPANVVAVIDLSNANVTEEALEIDWASFGKAFPNLAELRLNSNAIRWVPGSALEAWKQTKLRLALGDNPYLCGCEVQGLLEFVLVNHQRVIDLNSLACDNRTLISLTVEELCPFLQTSVMAAIIGVLVMMLLSSVTLLVAWRFRRTVRAWMYASGCCLQWVIEKDDADDEDKPYDAFVSFSHKDEDFILNVLVPALEAPTDGSPAYRLCLHYRDWLAGEWIPEQIARSVASSKRTIVVLSQHFLESVWGQLEFRTAYNQVLKDKRNRLIVLVRGDLPPKDLMDQDLKTYLSLNTYLQWGDSWFWERLRYALPHKKGKLSNLTNIYLDSNRGEKSDHIGASILNKGLAPLPLTRVPVKLDIVVPPEIELNLTPTSSVGSGDPIFPQDSR